MDMLTTDYQRFADENDACGLLPYLGNCILALIRDENMEELQILINNIAYVADELYDLNESIPAKLDDFVQKKAKMQQLQEAQRKREEMMAQLQAEMDAIYGPSNKSAVSSTPAASDPLADLDAAFGASSAHPTQTDESIKSVFDEISSDSTEDLLASLNAEDVLDSNAIPGLVFDDDIDAVYQQEQEAAAAGMIDQKDMLSIESGVDPIVLPDLDEGELQMPRTIREIDEGVLENQEVILTDESEEILEREKRRIAEEMGLAPQPDLMDDVNSLVDDDDIMNDMFSSDGLDDDFDYDIAGIEDFIPDTFGDVDEDLSAMPMTSDDDDYDTSYERTDSVDGLFAPDDMSDEPAPVVSNNTDGVLDSDFFD